MINETSRILKEMPKRNPTNGTFELTVRCNLHCKMCLFRHDDSENEEIMANELTAGQWIDMARQVAEAGTMSLLITGGEPMLRPDFCEIWEGIYKQGFVTTLYTNATLVTPKIMETLKKYPPHKIGITIYGASPETYEKVCGSGQAFQKMIEGVHLLQDLPSILEFRTTLIKDNCADMLAIEELVNQAFGNEYFVTMSADVFQTVRGACGDVTTCRLSPEKMWELRIEKLYESAKIIIGSKFDPDALKFSIDENNIENSDCKQKKLSLFGCKAGMDSYVVSWDGKLLACQIMGPFSISIGQTGFKNAWETFPNMVKLPPPNPACFQCKVAEYCKSCYASRFAETGALNGCSDYMLKQAFVNKKMSEKLKERVK